MLTVVEFYISCAAVEIQGSGHADPAGATFPGTYKKDDPGLNYKLYKNTSAVSEKTGYVSAMLHMRRQLHPLTR